MIARIAWGVALALAVIIGRPAAAEDLLKVGALMYASCIQQNFFMTAGKRLDDSCRCFAQEVTPFLSADYQQAVTDEVPYEGPKPISDTVFGIVMMARCPATTPLIETMWCGPHRDHPDWCMRFRLVRNGIFGGPDPWPAAPERGSPQVLAALTASCMAEGAASASPALRESCACFARETAPFHVQAFHDAINGGRAYEGRTALAQDARVAVMTRRCPDAEVVEKARFCTPPAGSEEECGYYETTKTFIAE